MSKSIFSVTDVNSYIAKTFSGDFILTDIDVKGEVSNCKYHSNGNIYFSLRDDFSTIKAIVPSNVANELGFQLSDGKRIVVGGRVQLTINRGEYSLIAGYVEELGIGALHRAFLQLKERLEKEGLFDDDRKKELPKFVKSVGVITSRTGAVIHDIINVITHSNTSVNVYLFPATVQGVDAPKSLIDGVKFFNESFSVDVIIIGRGGGSYEDLSVFNDEELARAVAGSRTPIISAVGHQTDFVITDFVADVRAATPTRAAEIAIRNNEETVKILSDNLVELRSIYNSKIGSYSRLLNINRERLKQFSPILKISNKISQLKAYRLKLETSVNIIFNDKHKRLLEMFNNLVELNPAKIAENTALIMNSGNEYINSVSGVKVDEDVFIELSDGVLRARVMELMGKGEE